MNVQINTRKLNPLQRSLVKDAVRFVCSKFMPRHKLEFTIKGIPNLLLSEGIYGDCMWNDDYNKPREFMLRVDTELELRTFLETVMHELVHAKQWVKSEMKYSSRLDCTIWNGHALPRKIGYYDYPWEIEARGREYGLTEEFLETHKKWVSYVVKGFTDYKMLRSPQMVLPFDR